MSEAMDVAKDAARRREHDLAEDLRGAGPTPPTSERPTPTPTPTPTPKPDPWPQPEPTPKPDPAPVPPDELPRPTRRRSRGTTREGSDTGDIGTKSARSRDPCVTTSPIAWHQGHGSAPGGGWGRGGGWVACRGRDAAPRSMPVAGIPRATCRRLRRDRVRGGHRPGADGEIRNDPGTIARCARPPSYARAFFRSSSRRAICAFRRSR
jgi:hypothetical protein